LFLLRVMLCVPCQALTGPSSRCLPLPSLDTQVRYTRKTVHV
jgi:hypothetical protein